MPGETDDAEGHEAHALDYFGGASDGPPEDPASSPQDKCPHCGARLRDAYDRMTRTELYEALHDDLLRDLARKFESGQITHQEENIVLRLLVGARMVGAEADQPPEEVKDDGILQRTKTPTPVPSPATSRDGFDESEGG